ncbi:TPA: hypothetical protein MEA72_004536 [Klebsiella aerogenes]|nr:hypothetical protein [Klebsiella aerogenes]
MKGLKLSVAMLVLTSSIAAHAGVVGAGVAQSYQLDVVNAAQLTHSLTPVYSSLESGNLPVDTRLLKGDVTSSSPVSSVALQWINGTPDSDESRRVYADKNDPNNQLVVKFSSSNKNASMQDGGDGSNYFVVPAEAESGQTHFEYMVVSAQDQKIKAGSYEISVNAYQWVS